MNDIEPIDLAPLSNDLATLLERAHGANDRAAFQDVPELLRRVVGCATAVAEDVVDGSWSATRSVLEDRTTIICWLDEPAIVLAGSFVAGALESWLASTERLQLDMIKTSHGELFTDGQGAMSGAVGWMNEASIQKRADEALARWRGAHQAPLTITCSVCEFDNTRQSVSCAMCGAPLSTSEPPVVSSSSPSFDRESNLEPRIPSGDSQLLLPVTVADVNRNSSYKDGRRCELILIGSSDERQEDLLVMIRELLQVTERSEELTPSFTASLPAVLLRDVSLSEAHSWAKRFESVGAAVEVRRIEL